MAESVSSDVLSRERESIVLVPPRGVPDQRSSRGRSSGGPLEARGPQPENWRQNGPRADGPAATRLSVVIPTLNEAANLEFILPQLTRFHQVIIVDGLSSDGTPDVVARLRPDATILTRPPVGKGDALRAGFAAATGDVIVMMDADGSMDPREVDAFVALIDLGYDLVKGSRAVCGGGSHDLTMIRALGNKALCWLGNRLFRTSWTDLCYSYIALRRSCVLQLALTGTGFEIETQILANAALANLRIAELPSVEMPRRFGDSHLNAPRDGLRVLWAMIGARCTPRARRVAATIRPVR